MYKNLSSHAFFYLSSDAVFGREYTIVYEPIFRVMFSAAISELLPQIP